MTAARIPFFFYIGDFTTRRNFAIPANHAATAQGSEAEKSNETHDALRAEAEQFACRSVLLLQNFGERACASPSCAGFDDGSIVSALAK
jgi:hypothetical protein